MKKVVKIIPVLIVLLLIATIFSTTVFAADLDPANLGQDPGAQTGRIVNVGNYLITIISVVGSVASVIVLIVLGLKYMMGSTEEKAEYKKTLLPYVVGAVLVFAASAIAGFVYQATSSIKAE